MSKFGFSWSWKRATGVSALRGKIARATGIPTTRAGRERKVGRILGNFGLGLALSDNAESTPIARQIETRPASAQCDQRLAPKYAESWLGCVLRRLVGFSVVLCSVVLLIVACSWYLDGTPSVKTSVVTFGAPGVLGLVIGAWMCRRRRRDRSPMATHEQMARIFELHGSLPRQVTAEEASDIITFLEAHKLDCPFCGAKCKASNIVCGACRKRLDAVRVPITIGG